MKLSALLVTLSSIAAFAQDAAAQPEQPGALASFLPLILLFVVMWLFFIRPKQKEMKQMDEMRKQLKKGDKVMTAPHWHLHHRIRKGCHPPCHQQRHFR